MSYTVIFQDNAQVSASYKELVVDGVHRDIFRVVIGDINTMIDRQEMETLYSQIGKALLLQDATVKARGQMTLSD